MTEPRDPTLDVLLDLDGQVLVVDPEGGHWVRFVVTRVPVSLEKPHGIEQCSSGGTAEARRAAGPSPPAADDQAYEYQDAATLLADFWRRWTRCCAREE